MCALASLQFAYALWLTMLEAKKCLRKKEVCDERQSRQDANYFEHSLTAKVPLRSHGGVSHTQPISTVLESLWITFSPPLPPIFHRMLKSSEFNLDFIYRVHKSQTSTGIVCLTRCQAQRNETTGSCSDFIQGKTPRSFFLSILQTALVFLETFYTGTSSKGGMKSTHCMELGLVCKLVS